ncbi:MAG: alpha/beta hydrolase [Planctomycetes bacterium]|nr:alpha/beta hydrolase [Planctomycetota bacterium]
MTPEIEHRYAQVNGIRMHYVIAGRGPLLLFLHGFPEFWWSWRHQLAEFARDYTVVAPDLRGYNETDKPATGYEMPVLVEDVVQLLRALGAERAVVAAHDWGGAVAWSLAISRPDCVERLIAMNIPHPALMLRALRTNPRQMLRSWYIAFFQIPWLPEFCLRWNGYWAIGRAFRGMAPRPDAFSDADLQVFKDAMARPGAVAAAVAYYRALRSPATHRLARASDMRVRAPTLLIWGEQDTALGKELTYGTEEFVPDLRIKYIPQSSHWVQQEEPELVNRFMREFLAEPRPLPAPSPP